MDYFQQLPLEVVHIIVNNLSNKDLCSASQVCKEWKNHSLEKREKEKYAYAYNYCIGYAALGSMTTGTKNMCIGYPTIAHNLLNN